MSYRLRANTMNLLFVSAEFAPLCGDEPLGRLLAGLTGALCGSGHDVTVVLPLRDPEVVDRFSFAFRLTPLEVKVGDETYSLRVFDGHLSSGVEIKFLGHDELFRGAPARPEDDAAPLRVALLAEGALSLAQAGSEPWHVVHGVSYAGALVPLVASRTAKVSDARRVLWLDDLDEEGRCDESWVEGLGLGRESFTPEGYELFGDLSLMKAGMANSHMMLTTNPSSLHDILSASSEEGLKGVMRARSDALTALLPGLDYSRWNPASDALIPARYDAEQPDGKPSCKAELQHCLGLPVRGETPLFILLPPAQDFASSLPQIFERILRSDVQLVAPRGLASSLGGAFEEAKERWPLQVAMSDFDETSQHRLLAGADVVLLDAPLRSDAELLLAAMRYGALPVVRSTGLARDLVVDLDPSLESGNGFFVESDDPAELTAVLRRALTSKRSGSRFGELLRRVMGQQCSWERTASQLEQVYAELLPLE